MKDRVHNIIELSCFVMGTLKSAATCDHEIKPMKTTSHSISLALATAMGLMLSNCTSQRQSALETQEFQVSAHKGTQPMLAVPRNTLPVIERRQFQVGYRTFEQKRVLFSGPPYYETRVIAQQTVTDFSPEFD